ncbi:ExbD/TolR family protein [Jeongeupia naejangsanensis]|uniref:Biopolymer transporter ExbD n=1 Tax=Jeongeupia naejangsanensis TaxID=613195 RepID=A0ABS2BG43_9NEIS|nr:biopolymer transporter ExbD [Jeongeupia naejangsanensis]MBM3114583.1 biopolymer transporter ExbD [Jeongeupia naejangsanensis]
MAISTSSQGDEVLSEMNITPLVDVMLVLLVAFIVTAPLLNNAVHINLPKTAATAAPAPDKAVTVSIDAQQRVFIDKREVKAESLETELAALKRGGADLSLNLQADEGVAYRHVAKAMASIERAGITRLSVLTQPGS